MYVLLLNMRENLKNYLVRKFIEEDIEVLHENNIKEARKLVKEKEIDSIVINFEVNDDKWYELLDEAQHKSGSHIVKIIVIIRKTNREFIQKLLMIGTVNFISASTRAEETYEKVRSTLNIYSDIYERRKYARVISTKDDKLYINFPIPNTEKLVKGKIVNISMGGIAFELEDKDYSTLFRDGQTIEKVQINLGGKLFLVKLQVIRRGPITAGKFLTVNDSFLTALANFIYEKMLIQ